MNSALNVCLFSDGCNSVRDLILLSTVIAMHHFPPFAFFDIYYYSIML